MAVDSGTGILEFQGNVGGAQDDHEHQGQLALYDFC